MLKLFDYLGGDWRIYLKLGEEGKKEGNFNDIINIISRLNLIYGQYYVDKYIYIYGVN